MQFLFPGFFIALAALAIPVLIHLFYFRRFKRVYFTNVRFLKELKEETSSRSRLRNLLVLLMRMLALAFLVFAFVQPFLTDSKETDTRPRAVSIFVDNSFSMSAMSQDLPLVERARQRALEILEAYGEADRFHIITHDLLPVHQRLVDKNTARGFIQEVAVTPQVRDLSVIHERQIRILEETEGVKPVAYMISDFQESITDLSDSSGITTSLVPLRAVQEKNLSLDSCWFESPVVLSGETARLLVRVTNYDINDAENIRVSLDYGGTSKPVGSINIPAGASVTDTLSVHIGGTGWQQLTVEISDYPIQFDDKYYMAFEAPEKIDVLALHDQSPDNNVAAAFKASPQFELRQQNIQQIDYAALPGYKLAVLTDSRQISSGLSAQLVQLVNEGSNVILFPGRDAQTGGINHFLTAAGAQPLGAYQQGEFQVSDANTQAFVFRDVFERTPGNLKLPAVQGRYALRAGSGEVLMRFRDGTAFLVAYPAGKGFVYVCAAPLDTRVSNFSQQAEWFIPFLYRAVLQRSGGGPAAYRIGGDEQIELDLPRNRGDMTYRMTGPSEFIPSVEPRGNKAILRVFNQVHTAGFYRLTAGQEAAETILAFNYDRQESNPACWKTEDLAARYPDYKILDQVATAGFSELVSEQDRGTALWRICLILALMFLLAEVCLLRFWKA